MQDFTPEALAALAGVLLSLAMSYIPGLSTGFAKLTTPGKQLVMATMLFLAAIGMAVWACSGHETGFGMCMGATDWRTMLTTLVYSLMANQATHRISPKRKKKSQIDQLLSRPLELGMKSTKSPLRTVREGDPRGY